MPDTKKQPAKLSPEAEAALERNVSFIRNAMRECYEMTLEEANEALSVTFAAVAIKFSEHVTG